MRARCGRYILCDTSSFRCVMTSGKTVSRGASKEEFEALVHNKRVLSLVIKACVEDAKDMDLWSIADCLELEEDGESVISLEPSGSDKRCEGLLDNVFRLRIPGKREIILVLNKG